MGNKCPEEEKKIIVHTFKSKEEMEEYRKNYYVDRIVEYKEDIKKWVGFIQLFTYRHEIGFYDTRDEAINKVLDKLKNAFGELENKPHENYFSMRYTNGSIC
jgi:hypothetical protein